MKKIKLFCDSSVNPQSKVGFAAFLSFEKSLENSQINTKKFEDTSSTKIELQSFLWAMENIKQKDTFFEVYTDCQNILSLLNRREKLESNNYLTSTKKQVKNHILYKAFYKIIDECSCEFIKVKGHKKSSLKDETDEIFSKVDKASRRALREYLKV